MNDPQPGLLAGTILRRPGLVTLTALAATALAALPIQGLEVTSSRRALVQEDHPFQERLLALDAEFPAAEPVIVVLHGGSPTRRRDSADRLQALVGKDPRFSGRIRHRVGPLREGLYHLASHASLIELVKRHERGLKAGAFGQLLTDGFELSRRKREAAPIAPVIQGLRAWLSGERVPLFEDPPSGLDQFGYFCPTDDAHLVLLYPAISSDRVESQRPVIEAIRAAADRARAPGVRAWVTGTDAISVDEQGAIRRGVVVSSIAAALGILSLLLIAFRSLRRSVIALVPMTLAIAWSYGFVALAFGELNLVTSNFTAVLMGLGIDFAIHFLARSLEARERLSPHVALVCTWKSALTPITVGAATSALAFLACTTTEFTAFAQMGFTSAVGLAMMWLFTVALLPALLLLSRGLEGATALRSAATWSRPWARVVERGAWPLLVLSVLGTLAAITWGGRPGFSARPHDFLPQSTEAGRGLRALEEAGATPFSALVPAETLEDARRMTQALRADPAVRAVRSPADLVPSFSAHALARARATDSLDAGPPTPPEALGQALATLSPMLSPELGREVRALATQLRALDADGRARWKELLAAIPTAVDRLLEAARRLSEGEPPALPGALEYAFGGDESTRYALFVEPVPFETVAEGERFLHALDAISSETGGTGLSLLRHSGLILRGFERASLYAWVAILLLVVVQSRSLSHGLLALLPVTLGFVWLGGVMALFDLKLDHANVVVLPILLGIGVDTGVHLVHRSREPGIDLHTLLGRTGLAVTLSGLTTGVGFGALLLAEYGAMRSFGRLMLLGLLCTWLASALTLPAWMVVRGRIATQNSSAPS